MREIDSFSWTKRIKENARNQQEQRELEMVRIRAQGQNNTDQNSEQNGGGRARRKFVIEIGKWKHEVTFEYISV